MTQYRNFDTRRKDGVYVRFERVENHDSDASPLDWMDAKNPDDAKRIEAWRNDEWYFIGIQARATVEIIRNGHGIVHIMTSGGMWAIESDIGDAYLESVFQDECDALRGDIAALTTLPITFD